MKKKALAISALLTVSTFAIGACSSGSNYGDYTSVEFIELTETKIGESLDILAGKLDAYTEENPLSIYLITDSGTLNDHSFNESSYKGVKEFAIRNGGGTVVDNRVNTGKIHANYIQPAENQYTTQGRYNAMKTAVEDGADVLVLPGYLFQGAIKKALEDSSFDDIQILALDCVNEDDEYNTYDYKNNITSIIYREEQAGYLAGYAAVSDGYTKLGFVGGMAVPAVIRYGSGYVQGAAQAAQDKGLTSPVNVQYYYAGDFASTPEATAQANTWYSTDTADIIFACGGSVYESVVIASKSNNNAAWIGVDVNQHADTGLGEATLGALKTSAMKNLQESVEVSLTSLVNSDLKWNDTYKKNILTVGAQSGMCKLPTPEADGDEGCWGFENYTVEQYEELYAKIQNGTVKINSNSDDNALKDNNFGVNPEYLTVNYIG